MFFGDQLIPATFMARPNRFLGEVEIWGRIERVFIPNPGRMEDLLRQGAEVFLLKRDSEGRKTRFDLVIVRHGKTLVSIDSRVPNAVVGETIAKGRVVDFDGMRIERREPTVGGSRLDFLLTGGDGSLLLEVKSCTLVKGDTAFFPDAPTARGTRHLKTLIWHLSRGRSAIFFLIQRGDTRAFRPNDETDPTFSGTLRVARNRGVELYAYGSEVSLEGISLGTKVSVEL